MRDRQCSAEPAPLRRVQGRRTAAPVPQDLEPARNLHPHIECAVLARARRRRRSKHTAGCGRVRCGRAGMDRACEGLLDELGVKAAGHVHGDDHGGGRREHSHGTAVPHVNRIPLVERVDGVRNQLRVLAEHQRGRARQSRRHVVLLRHRQLRVAPNALLDGTLHRRAGLCRQRPGNKRERLQMTSSDVVYCAIGAWRTVGVWHG